MLPRRRNHPFYLHRVPAVVEYDATAKALLDMGRGSYQGLSTRKKTILEASVGSNHVSYDIAVAHLNDDSQLRKTDIVEAIGCKQT